MALDFVPYVFEKSDAQEKYGGEIVFNAAIGGCSLCFTAEVVYETTCMQQYQYSTKYKSLKKSLRN